MNECVYLYSKYRVSVAYFGIYIRKLDEKNCVWLITFKNI